MSRAIEKQAWPRPILLLTLCAIGLRLVLFLGRGDYIAFDEGFYLLLGRSLVTGDGYSLIGHPHVALSPLFPLLAGVAGVALDSWTWGGRAVAAIASGLLVLPAWAIFRRLAPPRTAFIAVALVAVLPSLAPFVVPFWIGADLWVGAEPLLHLLLYVGVAVWLRAEEADRAGLWGLAGALFGLAFLARPEALLVWGLLGLAALMIAARRRSLRRLVSAGLMGLGLLTVAAPYWLYVHEVTGEWALTGRGISPGRSISRMVGAGDQGSAASVIERMLWADDRAYEEYLYALDESGLQMQSSYWGVQPRLNREDTLPVERAPATPPSSAALDASKPELSAEPREAPSTLALYLRALGTILPLLLWPFVILGLAQPRSPAVLRRELPVTLSLVGTSVAIAVVVAVDPRTQLFLVPLLALYAARGFSLVEQEIQRRAAEGTLRRGFVELVLAGIAVLWLLGINAQRLRLSLTVGSPHHTVGEQNRRVAEELDDLLPSDDGAVMSWHPALAVFADRDWRPLPMSDFPHIIRFAGASGADIIIASAYYPPPLGIETLGTRYLLLPVPEGSQRLGAWNLRVEQADSIRAVGRLTAPVGGD